jgi:hypothetical protein
MLEQLGYYTRADRTRTTDHQGFHMPYWMPREAGGCG